MPPRVLRQAVIIFFLILTVIFATLCVLPCVQNPWQDIFRDDFPYNTLAQMSDNWSITLFLDGSIRLERGTLVFDDPTGRAEVQRMVIPPPDDWSFTGSGAWIAGSYCEFDLAAQLEKRWYDLFLNGSSGALQLTVVLNDLTERIDFTGCQCSEPDVTIILRVEKVGITSSLQHSPGRIV
jgi:hypothetical protein